MAHVEFHTIPVPRGYTPEEAWEEIELLGRLIEPQPWWRFWARPKWANVRVVVDDDGTKTWEVLDAESS